MDEQEEKQGQGYYDEGLLAEPAQPKISKLAILTLVLGISSLFFFVLAGLPAIVIGIISTLRIRHSGGKLKGKYIALAGINISILFMYVFYLFWSIDAPPIPNDYSVADLRSAPAQYVESFEVLKTLIDENQDFSGFSTVELTKSDSKLIAEIRGIINTGSTSEISETLNDYAEEIKQIWADNEMARDVIRRLNEFPEIADLSEPGAGYKIIYWINLIELVRLYQVYAHLQTGRDDIHAFTEQLIELDSVCRKLSVNMRPFIGRAVCFQCLEEDIVTAAAFLNNPKTSRESIELLAQHFTPLTKEQMSLRNAILSEYFLLKDIISKPPDQGFAGKNPLLKRNSMLRLYRNFYDDWIEAVEDHKNSTRERLPVWPDIYPFAQPSMSFSDHMPLPFLYRCYNPLVRAVGFVYSSEMTGKNPTEQIQIRDDLFQIVLSKRLGKEIDLEARAYGDEYIVDVVNGKIFSPGHDGKADTRDDIILRINPDVLGLRN